MRTIFFIIISFIGVSLSAQTVKSTTFTVNGNCEDCKERIENAADIKGVKILKWDPDTKIANVTYDTTKTDLLKIKSAIATKGYDTDVVKANDAAYKKLPACCKYRDGVCNDKK